MKEEKYEQRLRRLGDNLPVADYHRGHPGIAVAAGSGGRHLTFSNDYRYFFSKENPQLNAFEALQDTYTKNDNVLFVIAPKNGRVFTRETLAIIEELTEASWQVPYSIRVDSITNFQHTRAEEDDLIVEDLAQNAASTLTDDELAAIKTIALNEPLLVAPPHLHHSAHVTGVNVTINLPGKRLDEVPEVARFVRSMAEDIRSKYPDVDLYLTGMTMMNNQFPEASQQDMATLVPIMFLVILVVMWLLIRSVAGTIATTLVIAMSAMTAMGLAGWYGIPLTGPSVSAPTIILTLAVADSYSHPRYHVLQHAAREEQERGYYRVPPHQPPAYLSHQHYHLP